MADDELTARALSGSCLCGRVRFEVRGDLGPADACHCVQCRKQSGHYFASTNVPRDALTVTGQEHLSWHQSSAAIRRGFCSTCGSFLHIFVAEKGDYYEIADGLPQHQH
jgi:hypothetical protein